LRDIGFGGGGEEGSETSYEAGITVFRKKKGNCRLNVGKERVGIKYKNRKWKFKCIDICFIVVSGIILPVHIWLECRNTLSKELVEYSFPSEVLLRT
jgi:hypothetical protein